MTEGHSPTSFEAEARVHCMNSMTSRTPMTSRPPLSPPPLTRSRRSSLTFSPSALERFRLPEAPPPAAVPSVRRSARLMKLKKPPPESSLPKKKKARTETSCCTICMGVPKSSELASIDGCSHTFCFECIQEWSDRENSCPNCKVRFGRIIPHHGESVAVTPRNQTNDILETMLGHLAASHQHWEATTMVPNTLQSLRLALTLQARTAAMRVIHTTTTHHHTSIRLQGFLRSHHQHHNVIGSYTHPIVVDDDDDEVQEVVQVLE